MQPSDRRELVSAFAEALLAGDWAAPALADRAAALLGDEPSWLPALCRRVVEAMPGRAGLTRERLAGWLVRDRQFRRAWRRDLHAVRARQWFVVPHEPNPPRVPLRAPVPALATPGDLADWLGIGIGRLEGLADLRGWLARAPEPLRHHRRWWVASRRADGLPRLLEAPKDQLRAVQRRILREILDQVPAHPAAHGFVEGRSVATAASVHAGTDWLVRLDLRSFFPSIHRRRIAGVFASMGFPPAVARRLGGLCTTITPLDVLRAMPPPPHVDRAQIFAVHRDPHLPQGAPSSPALANLCAYRLDARLAGLARRRRLHYTRYADDLFFSGPRATSPHRVVRAAAAIVVGEGFALHAAKQRVMGPGEAHRCLGLVVNRAPAVPRRERERLEAILTNCIRYGPASQNRGGHPHWREHLTGRVAWVAHVLPRHGARLQTLLDAIEWVPGETPHPDEARP